MLQLQHQTPVARVRPTPPGVQPCKRRRMVSVRSQNQQGGGLLSGFGKLFGGKAEAEPQAVVPQAPQQVASTEVFMMANTDEQPEYPPFQVIKKAADYDLRLYGVHPVVEMAYQQRQEGYAALGSFIDGENAEGVRFAYTQPVTMKYENGEKGAKVMQMYLGSRRGGPQGKAETVATLPAPKDPSIRVSIAGGELIAVGRFEGYITPTSAEAARQKLLAALQRDGIKLSDEAAAGGFRVGQYGAVYQLAGRINEIYIKVAV